MKEYRRAYVDLTAAMAIVGSSVVVGKLITVSFPLFLASAMRFGLAGLVLFIIASRREPVFKNIEKKDRLKLIVMALSGQFVFTLFLLWGLRMTSAADAGIITSATPAVMAVLAFVLLKEPLKLPHIVGVCLAVLGVLVVNGAAGAETEAAGANRRLGNLLICAAVLGEGVFLLLRKTISPALSNISLSAALCALGFVMSLPIALVEAWSFNFGGVGLWEWASILYFGLVFTVVAYVLWFRGVERVPGSVAGVFTAVMPVSAILLSYAILGEKPTWAHLAGGALVISAIVIITLGPTGVGKWFSVSSLKAALGWRKA